MLFPIFIFKDKKSDYGVVVPGLPSCFSAGKTIEEAMDNAKEAIELHLEGIVEDGEEIPEQKSVDDYRDEIEAGGVAALIDVDTSSYEAKQSERVNITFPKPLLLKMDKVSARLGMTRSGFLQKAASKMIIEVSGKTATEKPVRAVREPRPKPFNTSK